MGSLVVLRGVVGSVFVLSGLTTLAQPYQNFLAVIDRYEVLSGWSAVAAARLLPWAELVLGVFLVTGLWLRLSLAALWLLNTVFIGVVLQAILRRLPIENCGCFGETVSFSTSQILFLDLGLWAAFAFLMIFFRQASVFSLDRHFEKA